MKLIRLNIIFLILVLSLNAQETKSRKVAMLPFVSNGIDKTSTITAESILRLELNKKTSIDLFSENKTLIPLNDNFCNDEECAKVVGKELNADEVILCRLNILGEKIIVQYLVVDVNTGKNLLAEQTTALNLDDLELVLKRVAISIDKMAPFSSNVEVGNVVGKESVESLSRSSRYNFGLGFGYLFPQKGYDKDDKSFTLNAYFDHEINDFSVGLMAGARKGFAINLYGNYLFSKTDVCPYIGTSLGVHWIQHEEASNYYMVDDTWVEPEEKSGNGIELGLMTGIRILHTYNVQLFINFEYIVAFNDYKDNAIVFTIGIL